MLSRLALRFLFSCVALLILTSLLASRKSIPDRYLFRNLSGYYPPPVHSPVISNDDEIKPPVVVDETRNCDRCLTSPEWCSEFGSRNMDLSVAYEGTGERLRRAIAKSERGEPIKLGIIGGSLSRGHGCHCTTFHRQIFDWWNATYPHPDNIYVDGSVGARGSNYFKFCHGEHLRPDLDIVLLELSINDRLDVKDLRNVESILRSVLSYDTQPAVIMTASFSLMDKIEMGADAHLPVAQYYDVPGSRPPRYQHAKFPSPNYQSKTRHDEKYFKRCTSASGSVLNAGDHLAYFAWEHPDQDRVDILHFSKIGHTALAKTTIALIQRQTCILRHGRPFKAPDSTIFPPGQNYSLAVPRQRMTDYFKASLDVKSPIDRPTCMSIDSERNPLSPLPIATNKGWESWTLPRTSKRYLRATEVGARSSFEVELTSGHVAIYYLRSRSMGLGRAKCWFNDDERHAKELDGWWDRAENVGDFTLINDQPIASGKHIIHCQVLPKSGTQEGRGTTFLLIAVMTI